MMNQKKLNPAYNSILDRSFFPLSLFEGKK